MAPTATGPTAGSSNASTSAPTGSASTSTLPTSLEEANQRYTSTKLALRTGLANKRLIDRSLIDLESQIYLFEGSYLQSTSTSGGNIVKGFESYLKNASTSTARGNAAAAEIPLEDRIFSLSSATYAKSLELKANEAFEEEEPPKKIEEPSTAVKKKKDKEKDATPAKEKKKKDKDDRAKEKERSATPSLKAKGDAAAVTPTKTTGGKAPATGPKLKRKNADAAATPAATPGGKTATKRKKEDD